MQKLCLKMEPQYIFHHFQMEDEQRRRNCELNMWKREYNMIYPVLCISYYWTITKQQFYNMRKNKFANVLIIQEQKSQKPIINQPSQRAMLNENFNNNKIYFPINQQRDKLLPYKLSQKIDLHKKQKYSHLKVMNDENKEKEKTKKIQQVNIRKKSFNRQKKFIDLFSEEDNKNVKHNQISRNTISFRKATKFTVTSSGNHIYRSKNIKSLKNMDMKINNTLSAGNQISKEIIVEEFSHSNLKKTKSQINSMTSPKINKDYSAYLPSKKYSRSKLYSTRHTPQKINIGSEEDWICQKLIRQQVYAFENQQTQI